MGFNKILLLCLLFSMLRIVSSCNAPVQQEINTSGAKEILETRKQPGDTLKFWSYRKIQQTIEDSTGRSSGAAQNPVVKVKVSFTPVLLGIYSGKDSTQVVVYQSMDKGLTWNKKLVKGLEMTGNETAHVLNKNEWVSIHNKDWFYLDYINNPGKGKKGVIHFDLLDPITGKLISLKYNYRIAGGQFIGGFSKADLDSLKNDPAIFSFLDRKAAASELIPAEDHKSYLPTSDAALRKWAMLNEGLYEALDDKQSKILHLNVEEYNSDITADNMAESKAGDSSLLKSENGTFRVVSDKTGPVYVINKQNKHSFLIWAPADSNSRIEKMKLKNTNTLLLYPHLRDSTMQPYSIEINLIEKTVKKSKVR